MSKWISVDDRLPDDNVDVLTWCNDGQEPWTQVLCMYVCPEYGTLEWLDSDLDDIGYRVKITHWMPLPEPPKQ